MDVLRRNGRQIDFVLVGVTVLLLAYGCVAVLAATYSNPDPNIPSHAWIKQLLYGVVGLGIMTVMGVYDYRGLRKYHWWIYGVTTVLLVAVFGFHSINGAHSWIPLSVFSIQPSEFAKISLIVSTAAFLAGREEAEFPDRRWFKSWPVLALLIVPFALTYKEPALGQALVMLAITGTMYVMYMRRAWFGVAITFLVTGGVLVVAVPILFPQQAIQFVNQVVLKHHLLRGYQADRILTWLNPSYQLSSAGYNIHQAQVAIGSGQLFGQGFLNGVETNAGAVPNQWTDYIFSAIGEEFGFVGGSILVLLFMIMVHRLIRIAANAQDAFGSYVVMGIVGMFAFQVFENVGMDVYMSPSTGITLPFISYGGSSIVANLMCIGLALSVALRRKKLYFG